MSQYQRSCTTCKQQIEMSDRSGKWLPYNMDNSLHSCRGGQNGNGNGNGTTTAVLKEVPKVETQIQALTLEELDSRLKRLENILEVIVVASEK